MNAEIVEIPDGWIAVCSYDKRPDKSSGGATGEYAALLKAVKKHEIDSMSIGRPKRWYVREDQAERYLNNNFYGRSVRQTQIDSTAEAVPLLLEIRAMLKMILNKDHHADDNA